MPRQADLQPRLDALQTNRLINSAYPELNNGGHAYRVVEILPGGCVVRLEAGPQHLRFGGTVSGPSLFMLADIGGYACVLSHAEADALSVTTNLSINFMRKALPGPLDAHCRILKLGRSLMVFDAEITDVNDETIAHAVGTYAMPPHTQSAKV